MGESIKGVRTDPTLTDAFTRRLGFDRVADLLPGNAPPVLVYGAAAVVLDFGTVNVTAAVAVDRQYAFVANPFSLAIPAFVLTAAVGVWYMATAYQRTIEDIQLTERSDTDDVPSEGFTVSFRTKLVVYLSVVAGYWLYLFGMVGLDAYLETMGATAFTVVAAVVYPLGYIPIAVEFLLLFASINVLLPKRLVELRPKPAFLDPRDLGGFYPVGELLKRSYYLYTACLLLYLSYVYGPVLAPFGARQIASVGFTQAGFFTLLWLFGIAAVGNAVYRVHRVMAAEKRAQLRELQRQLHDIVDDPYDILSVDLHDNTEVENVQRRLEQVRAMNVYPTTIATSTKILVSVLVPQATQVVLQAAM